MQNPFTIGDRLYLRPLEPRDAAVVGACNNDPQVRASFFTHTPASLAVTEDRIKGYYQQGSDYLPFAICLLVDNRAIGVTALHRLDLVSRAAVYSVCLSDTAEWGHGYASEATRLMLDYAFDVLNLHRIQLHVWIDNKAAVRSYEKCGFVHEGTLRQAMRHNGEWCDFYVMGILEEEWKTTRRRKP